MFPCDSLIIILLADLKPARSRRRPIENLRNFLKRVTLCLGEHEESHSKNEEVKAAKENIIMPSDILQRDWVDERKDDQ